MALREELERIGRERLAAEREAERMRRRRFWRASLECIAASLAGLVIMGFAFHVSDRETGEILLSAGMLVGYAGIAWSLGRAYLSAEKHGDI